MKNKCSTHKNRKHLFSLLFLLSILVDQQKINWILELFRRCNIFYLSFYVPSLVPFGPVVSDWLIDFWCFNATFNNISATMYIMATSFSGGGSRSTRREPLTMGKQLVIFITCGFFCNLQSRARTHAVLICTSC